MMKRRLLLAPKIFAVCLFAIVWIGLENLQAGLLTSGGEMPGSSMTVDFHEFSGGSNYTSGPIQIGSSVGENITWRTNYGGSVIGNGYYSLGTNGSWNSGRNGYTGLNSPSSSAFMRYIFEDGPVGAVGGFVNYVPTRDFIIRALDASMNPLESYEMNRSARISTGGQQNAGAFRGISRTTNDIAAFELRGAYGVLDDLTFGRHSTSPPPTPTTSVELAPSATFSVRNGGNGDPTGDALIDPQHAQVGNLEGGGSPDVRGMVEFDLDDSEPDSVSSATLDFSVLEPYLLSGSPSLVHFDIVVEAYLADTLIDPSDFQTNTFAVVSDFSTSGLRPPQSLSFDVTNIYRDALAIGSDLGFRLRQLNETGDSRHLGYTFHNFQLEAEFETTSTASTVPEPSSIALFSLGALGMAVVAIRRRKLAAAV